MSVKQKMIFSISTLLASLGLDGDEAVGVLKLLARVVVVHVECDDAALAKHGRNAGVEIPVAVEGTYYVGGRVDLWEFQ